MTTQILSSSKLYEPSSLKDLQTCESEEFCKFQFFQTSKRAILANNNKVFFHKRKRYFGENWGQNYWKLHAQLFYLRQTTRIEGPLIWQVIINVSISVNKVNVHLTSPSKLGKGVVFWSYLPHWIWSSSLPLPPCYDTLSPAVVNRNDPSLTLLPLEQGLANSSLPLVFINAVLFFILNQPYLSIAYNCSHLLTAEVSSCDRPDGPKSLKIVPVWLLLENVLGSV